MGLKDELEESTASAQLPAKYRQHFELEGDTGTASTGLVDEALIGSHSDMLRLAGLDPDVWVIEGKIHQWTKTRDGKAPLKSVFFAFKKRTEAGADTAKALAELIKPVKPAKIPAQTGDPMVICTADTQIGKTDKLCGTTELLQRYADVLGQAAAIAKADKPSHIVIGDLGDCIEGITSSAPNQIATNDLTPDEQLRLWQRMLTQAILTFQTLAPKLTVVGVPSNHAEVRNSAGKVGQGDYGLSTLGSVQDAFELLQTGNSIEWVTPPPYEVSATVETGGTQIAFFHGHHVNNQTQIDQWLGNQAASPGARLNPCTIAVHGHFHNFRYRRSTLGRELISCPTLDSGSSWFTNRTGEASPPGLVVFKIRDGRVSDLRCLEPA